MKVDKDMIKYMGEFHFAAEFSASWVKHVHRLLSILHKPYDISNH